ncbi:hypothetical protein DPX16_12677 [Anabarilius grahami]|uniref:Uncharacterized protein n=1 Tax=Anabarilius grahami TaxID=495550 RepID=A0A3N0XVH7_ANAGA|nr:hypothetical protein DPX16_12677 [Anabarilius grahami]
MEVVQRSSITFCQTGGDLPESLRPSPPLLLPDPGMPPHRLCRAFVCISASSKQGGPSQSRTHRPSPWAPGARAAGTQRSPSTRLKGVKSA